MELTVHQRSDITHIVLEGRLDANGVEEIEREFTNIAVGRGLPTVVDMSQIAFMSSLGIGFLFGNMNELKKVGQKLVLLNPQDMVEQVLRLSKADCVMPIVSSLDEAIQTLNGEAPKPATAPGPATEPVEVDPPVATPRIKLSIKNDLPALNDLYARVEEFLAEHSIPYRSGYAVNLAIEELVVNVIRYAYMDYNEHLIHIDLRIDGEQLVLIIEDDGRPFDPREGPQLQPDVVDPHVEDPEIGGLGIMLVLDMVDRLSYQRLGEMNRTEVRIQIRDAEQRDVSA